MAETKNRIIFDVDLNKFEKDINKLNNKSLQELADETSKKINPYVPWKTGALGRSKRVRYDPKNRDVQFTWSRVYAEHQFNNIGANFTKDTHPQAQAEWTKPILDNSPLMKELVNTNFKLKL